MNPENDINVENQRLLAEYMRNADILINRLGGLRDEHDEVEPGPEPVGLLPRIRDPSPDLALPMEVAQNNIENIDDEADSISTLYKCQSRNARKLCIYDAFYKLEQQQNDIYDIGGAYTNTEHDLWFYFSTAVCPAKNYLLNLFVRHRRPGNFIITISGSNELIHHKKSEQSCLPPPSVEYTFRSAKCDETHYIKTFCFDENNLKQIEDNILCIGININMEPKRVFNYDVVKRIKLNHDFGELLMKPVNTDFILHSASQTPFKAHKIVLAAHSPVLRGVIENTKSNSEFIDITDKDMELLLEFLYTGTIKDVLKQDCLKLLEIASRFHLDNMFLLIEYALGEQINVDTAINIAVLAEKYKLDNLQHKVFDFVRNNLDVLMSDGWKSLNDVNLAKKLFQYIHTRNFKESN